jgi:hypothetical protein
MYNSVIRRNINQLLTVYTYNTTQDIYAIVGIIKMSAELQYEHITYTLHDIGYFIYNSHTFPLIPLTQVFV